MESRIFIMSPTAVLSLLIIVRGTSYTKILVVPSFKSFRIQKKLSVALAILYALGICILTPITFLKESLFINEIEVLRCLSLISEAWKDSIILAAFLSINSTSFSSEVAFIIAPVCGLAYSSLATVALSSSLRTTYKKSLLLLAKPVKASGGIWFIENNGSS